MAPLSIVEHLDVVEEIGPRLIPSSVADPVLALSFEEPKEALDEGIVIAVRRTAHAAVDAVLGELSAEVVAGILAAAVRVVDEGPLGPARRAS